MRYRVLGVRLAAAAMVPLALSGCVTAGGEPQDQNAAAPAAGKAGEGWMIVQRGDVVPVELLPAVVAPQAEEDQVELAEPKEAEEVHESDARCTGSHLPGRIAGLQVEPGETTATVRWFHPGDATVVSYQVTSIAQSLTPGVRPEFVWQEVAPGEGCHELTATVTGLQPESSYVFSVDAVRRPTWQNTPRTATVARSEAVMTR